MPQTTQPAHAAHFAPSLFAFLRSLKRNNTRDWFQENKARYIEQVRDPMLRFIEQFARPLAKISPHFVADPSPNGGSMFRIHRDTRFSKDKSPYKTHCAAQFRHEEGRDVHAPGFYLHLEPGSVFAGAGIWHPDTKTANAIREHLAIEVAAWKRIKSAKSFKDGTLSLEGDSLKRPPRGFDASHPLIEDLKRKDFIVVANFDEKEACSPGFLKTYTDACRKSAPFVRFIADALDLDS